jgi:hypothetical protein
MPKSLKPAGFQERFPSAGKNPRQIAYLSHNGPRWGFPRFPALVSFRLP